jgi:hypothetical protein
VDASKDPSEDRNKGAWEPKEGERHETVLLLHAEEPTKGLGADPPKKYAHEVCSSIARVTHVRGSGQVMDRVSGYVPTGLNYALFDPEYVTETVGNNCLSEKAVSERLPAVLAAASVLRSENEKKKQNYEAKQLEAAIAKMDEEENTSSTSEDDSDTDSELHMSWDRTWDVEQSDQLSDSPQEQVRTSKRPRKAPPLKPGMTLTLDIDMED